MWWRLHEQNRFEPGFLDGHVHIQISTMDPFTVEVTIHYVSDQMDFIDQELVSLSSVSKVTPWQPNTSLGEKGNASIQSEDWRDSPDRKVLSLQELTRINGGTATLRRRSAGEQSQKSQ